VVPLELNRGNFGFDEKLSVCKPLRIDPVRDKCPYRREIGAQMGFFENLSPFDRLNIVAIGPRKFGFRDFSRGKWEGPRHIKDEKLSQVGYETLHFLKTDEHRDFARFGYLEDPFSVGC